jgi:hypothetical protein
MANLLRRIGVEFPINWLAPWLDVLAHYGGTALPCKVCGIRIEKEKSRMAVTMQTAKSVSKPSSFVVILPSPKMSNLDKFH